jgi:hypothetical protein
MIHYKGKGEHSVNQLEQIIEQQNEELHQLKTLHVKYLDRLKQEYKESLGGSMDDRNYRRNRYSAVRVFCLDCELVSFNEVELMEFEVNQSF